MSYSRSSNVRVFSSILSNPFSWVCFIQLGSFSRPLWSSFALRPCVVFMSIVCRAGPLWCQLRLASSDALSLFGLLRFVYCSRFPSPSSVIKSARASVFVLCSRLVRPIGSGCFLSRVAIAVVDITCPRSLRFRLVELLVVLRRSPWSSY